MKFLLFAGKDYYPLGGWKDLKGSYSTLPGAVEKGTKLLDFHRKLSFDERVDWFHVVDGNFEIILARRL